MNMFISNTKALPYIQLVATALVVLFAIVVPQSASMWMLSVGIYVIIGCFGISIGYHRLLTHKSFKTSKFWERFCSIAGALAFTGSSIGWVGVHRQHHRFSDKKGDPHSPAVYGAKMLVANYQFDPNKWPIRYLITNNFHLFMHKYYFAILIIWSLFWTIFGIDMLMYVVVIPAVISVWTSTISNYMNHKNWGYKNFNISDHSSNLWINAIFTFGEGWHNNHHARPGDFSFQHHWWEIDMGGEIIKLIKK